MIDFAFDFTGRHALITGGTRGVGLAIAEAFMAAGAIVSVTGTKILPSLYDADLSRFRYSQLQLASSDAIDSFLDRLDDVDVVVNCAGAKLPGGLDQHERELISHSARLGLVGPARLVTRMRYRLTKSKVPGGGAVINTSAARRWLELTQSATDAQAELASQTRRLGDTWARHGARVNTVIESLPVAVPSQLRVQISHHSGPLLTRSSSAPTRTGSINDVAGVVLFLASSGAAAITGQTFQVNIGGLAAAH